MKILMISNAVNSRTAGVARIMHYLREEAVRLGHQFDLVFRDDVFDPFGSIGLRSVTFPWSVLGTIRRLFRERGPYDVVNLHTLAAFGYVWLRQRWPSLPKCVVMSYGSDELRWELEKEEARLGLRPISWKAHWLYEPAVIAPVRYAIRHTDHVFVEAQSERQFYISRHGIPANRVSAVPNGVSEEFFVQRRYAGTPSKLLYLGGWEWRKGIRYLAQAFSRVASEEPLVSLTLAGTGDSEEIVKSSFERKYHPLLTVIPHLPAEDLPALYSRHDLFVFPSLFEGCPLVIPEAMASGLPVVTTRTCGMQDIVLDGVSGLLVPPRDSKILAQRILFLLKDVDLCARLGKAAQQGACNLMWQNIARQHLDLYGRLSESP